PGMSIPRETIVYIISAPSGSGKSTLVNEVLKTVPGLDFSISYTTRPSRGSEQNGKQYHFVTRERFERMVEADEFLEHAEFDGNCYGTARQFLREAQRKGTDLLLDIDVQGATQIQQKLPDAVSIFVLPPDKKELEWRLRKRGENDEQDIRRRLEAAGREIEEYDRYNYVLINDKLEKSIERFEAIVLSERLQRENRPLSDQEATIVERAERLRLANLKEKVQPILSSFRTLAPSAQP
ncbi:MAG: guanylate kinase, partial [Candidatus Sulfotelmatobacter sp.]